MITSHASVLVADVTGNWAVMMQFQPTRLCDEFETN